MRFLLLLLSALLVTVHAQDNSTTSPPTTAPPTIAAATTTPPTTTAATTPPPKSTVTENPPNTDTSTAIVSTTIAPTTPAPVGASVTLWNITDATGNVCLLMEVAAQMNVTSGISGVETVYLINLEQNDTMNGVCSQDNVTQEVAFDLNDGSILTMLLTYDAPHSSYGLTSMVYDFKVNGQATNASANKLEDNTDADYEIDSGSSYTCVASIPINFTEVSVSDVQVHATLSNFKYQAFISKSSFNTERRCGADFGTSDIVPIAVGCALAALVVIVLIAYLIGRRRSRQKGYQSV